MFVVVTDAVDSLLNVVVGIKDAVLEAETARVTVSGVHLFKLSKDLTVLILLAEGDLLEVGL